uniref:AGE family epimerase/isomerase n=1 Tax=Marinobacterium profundum TaxID=1714300 RepID=UPI0008322B5A|nr:AGE family epimerase/isomerase [Marinobacterium profundum]
MEIKVDKTEQGLPERCDSNFRSRDFLLQHIRHTLSFYEGRSVDPAGGFFHCYMNDGTVFDPGLRTLVASCRFVFNYAKAYGQFGDEKYQSRVVHGLNFLRESHRNPQTGGYAWVLRDGNVLDDHNHCYGLAFVLLAYACGVEAGVPEAKAWLYETFDLLEEKFWDKKYELYASEASVDWTLDPYRGQNDNMHTCEALIAAYEVTQDEVFLDRACLLASHMTRRQSQDTGSHVWEHYTQDWKPDLEYNRNDKTNSIRPWGVQTGHQTEWTKLLLILDRHRPEAWRLARAKELFDSAMAHGWDNDNTGLIYGYDLEGQEYDQDKYFWVQAESLAAAALLADRTGDKAYWAWYDKIWDYSFTYFVDHEYGAWYRILTVNNLRYDDKKSYKNKTDYHTMGACYEMLNVISQ